MAKSGKKDGKKKDGRKANPIPKEVGGIKVPKELRKAGRKAVALVQDPIVSEVVAAALLSAAAALRAPPKPRAKTSASGTGERDGHAKPNPIGDTIKGLALDLARRTLEGAGGRQRTRSRKPESRTPEEGDA